MLRRSIQKAKNNKKIVTSALMIILGGFFYFRNVSSTSAYYSQDYLLVNGKANKQVDLNLIKAEATGNINDARIVFADSQTNSTVISLIKSDSDKDFKNKLLNLVGDAPIKDMVPDIAKEDTDVAAYLVGIAKKESSWGLASPSKDGKTCYNYWGYKGSGSRGTGMGYSCFGSPQEAVETVGGRIGNLINQGLKTPSQMVVWKCGGSCAGDDGAQSWIGAVSTYYQKVLDLKK
jgi:hypothetical protein